MPHLLQSASDTEAWGYRLGESLRQPVIFAFTGDLGVGKTVLTQGLARGLGVRERVLSPTFSLVREYKARLPLYHFDLYRLSGFDELVELGWDEYVENGVIVLEWSERVREDLPPDTITLDLQRHPSKPDARLLACLHPNIDEKTGAFLP